MAEKDISNFLKVEAADEAQLSKAMASVKNWLKDEIDSVQSVASDSFCFKTEWEPPFKAIKALSKENPGVVFTIWGDAFSKHHWICKSKFTDGKSEDWVVSMVDDDFESIFEEVYGTSYDQWKEAPTEPFAQLTAEVC